MEPPQPHPWRRVAAGGPQGKVGAEWRVMKARGDPRGRERPHRGITCPPSPPSPPHLVPAWDLRVGQPVPAAACAPYQGPGRGGGKGRAPAPEGRGATSPRPRGVPRAGLWPGPRPPQPGGAGQGPTQHEASLGRAGGLRGPWSPEPGRLPLRCREACVDDRHPSSAMTPRGAGVEGGGDRGNSHMGNLGIGLPEQKGVRKLGRGSVSKRDFGES